MYYFSGYYNYCQNCFFLHCCVHFRPRYPVIQAVWLFFSVLMSAKLTIFISLNFEKLRSAVETQACVLYCTIAVYKTGNMLSSKSRVDDRTWRANKHVSLTLNSRSRVLWYCWLGLLTCKNRLPYNLYCVGGDVKTLHNPIEWAHFWSKFEQLSNLTRSSIKFIVTRTGSWRH